MSKKIYIVTGPLPENTRLVCASTCKEALIHAAEVQFEVHPATQHEILEAGRNGLTVVNLGKASEEVHP